LAPDPVVLDEVRAWLRKAAQDLRAAEISETAQPPLLETAVFHCQQAAEKAFKALLVLHGQVFRKTHSIEEVGEQALAIDPSLRPVVDRAVPLTEYAWKFRYPGMPEELTGAEAQEALATARDVLNEIVVRVPESARP
jgi:HEPN domain-containing protein